jgi:hypothetical protein
MNILIQIVLIYALVQLSIAQQEVKQKGLGLNCGSENRDFWKNVALTDDHRNGVRSAFWRSPFPVFDRNLYSNYKGNRGPVDDMMYKGFKYFYPLVLDECIKDDGRKDRLNKIEQYINNLLDWPTWVEVDADKQTGFQSYNQKQHYVDLFACK